MKQTSEQITHRLVTQTVVPTAQVIPVRVKLKLSVLEVVDGNDGVLAAGIVIAATMQSFVLKNDLADVINSTDRAHVLVALLKIMHT